MKKGVAILLGNAFIWGFVIIACSYALKGTDAYNEIQPILAGGALTSLMVVGLGVIKQKG